MLRRVSRRCEIAPRAKFRAAMYRRSLRRLVQPLTAMHRGAMPPPLRAKLGRAWSRAARAMHLQTRPLRTTLILAPPPLEPTHHCGLPRKTNQRQPKHPSSRQPPPRPAPHPAPAPPTPLPPHKAPPPKTPRPVPPARAAAAARCPQPAPKARRPARSAAGSRRARRRCPHPAGCAGGPAAAGRSSPAALGEVSSAVCPDRGRWRAAPGRDSRPGCWYRAPRAPRCNRPKGHRSGLPA